MGYYDWLLIQYDSEEQSCSEKWWERTTDCVHYNQWNFLCEVVILSLEATKLS